MAYYAYYVGFKSLICSDIFEHHKDMVGVSVILCCLKVGHYEFVRS